jgi:hypothetical protein
MNLSAYVTTSSRKTFYLITNVTIRSDIQSTVDFSAFLTDYKYLYIVLDIFHPNQQNFDLYIIFYNLNYFRVHSVSNIGSHSTQWHCAVSVV